MAQQQIKLLVTAIIILNKIVLDYYEPLNIEKDDNNKHKGAVG